MRTGWQRWRERVFVTTGIVLASCTTAPPISAPVPVALGSAAARDPSPRRTETADPRGASRPLTISSWGRVTLSELPDGEELPGIPDFSAAPQRIRGRHTVPGFHVARPPRPERSKVHGPLPHVFASPEAARRFAMTADSRDPTSGVCFCRVRSVEGRGRAGDGWPGPSTNSAVVPIRHSYGGPIMAVHAERLSQPSDDALLLTSADFWVDVKTLGQQPITNSSIELLRLHNAPDGIELYAARGGPWIHVVIRPSGERVELIRVDAPAGETFSSCDYVRVSLAIPAEAESGPPLKVSIPADETGRDERTVIVLRVARTVAAQALLWVEDPNSDRYRGSGSTGADSPSVAPPSSPR